VAARSYVKARHKGDCQRRREAGLVEIDGDEVRILTSLPAIEPACCPALEALVSQLELEHPHFRVPYGTADPTLAGRGLPAMLEHRAQHPIARRALHPGERPQRGERQLRLL
jgi:hypothetical protein